MITISAGQDPATCSIRMNSLDGSYDSTERVVGPLEIAIVIEELGAQLARIMQHQRVRRLPQSRDSAM